MAVQSALTVTERPKKRFPLSFLLAGIAILGAIIYLVYANTQANAVYYLTVTELKTCTTCNTQAVRVSGIVQPGSIVRDEKTQQVTFVVVEGGQSLPVTYSGIVPDVFGPDIQVVVEGNYTGQGPFEAKTLLAKCPSKFTSTPTP